MANASFSVYPDALDGYASLPLRKDGVHEIVADDHNRLRDAIVKIEQELGVQPSGVYATVTDRLDDIGDATALIVAHLADTTDAHDASAISILDTPDNYVSLHVEGALGELSELIPISPDEMGLDSTKTPNGAIPSLFESSGTKFVFNISSADSIHRKTQPSKILGGLQGIHVVEVGDSVPDGYGYLRLTGGVGSRLLEFLAPGDVFYGTPVSVEVSEGDHVVLSSDTVTKKVVVTRNSIALSVDPSIEEQFEFYSADFVSGYYSLPSQGFRFTQHITKTSPTVGGTSRLQFMIGGTVFPADRGTLVLQRKIRGSTEFAPVAILDLGTNFDETKRLTGQPIYVPALTLFDTVTLYDRYPVKNDYSLVASNASGSAPYDDFSNNFSQRQLAKYVIPMSNSEIVGGTLTSPTDILEADANTDIAGYRIFHYKEGVSVFTGNPSAGDVYGLIDPTHPASENDADSTIRFSNVYADDSETRPGVNAANLRPVLDAAVVGKTISGVNYYNSAADLFEIGVLSNTKAFSKTYIVDGILTFTTDVFSFPDGYDDGVWGTSVSLTELTDDGYTKFSNSNLPAQAEQALYIVDDTTSINGVPGAYAARRIFPKSNNFSNHSWIRATMNDPFGAGDGYDAYGAESIHRILVNSYSTTRATDTIEYFTDESNRISDAMVFDPVLDDLIPADGYTLVTYDSTVPLAGSSLQVGGKFTSDEFNVAGLVYPQTDYFTPVARIRPTQQVSSLMNYEVLTGTRQYQRLFSLGYPINSGKLRIVSGGNSPISFEDIRQGNLGRFARFEIKVPGHGPNSTQFLDLGRLFSTGGYEDGYGAVSGTVTGSAGDFTIPFTFGPVNTAAEQSYPMDFAVAVRVTYFGETLAQRQASKERILTMIQLLP